MPLPPAPTQRAALLNTAALEANPAKPSATRKAAVRRSSVQDDAPLSVGAVVAQAPLEQVHTKRPQSVPGASPQTRESLVLEAAEAPHATEALRTQPSKANTTGPATSTRTANTRSTAPKKKRSGPAKLFVLDTNVLMHDPMCLFRFEEHDVFLPMIVLEELDGHKKGMTEVARNARQTSRSLDALVASHLADITTGISLSGTGHSSVGGRLFFQTEPLNFTLPASLPQGKADNQILGVVEALRAKHAPREVVLVSKDINMRVKARALGLAAEDYQNDKTLEDGDLLYAGAVALPADFWAKQPKSLESWQSGGHTYYRVSGLTELHINQFVYYEAAGEPSLQARVTEIRGNTVVLKTLKDFTSAKHAVWGVNARNREQNFAMNLLTDPEVDFVTLTGTAGTGKTLMALAAGLTQVLDERRYSEIIMTRATVSMGDDIGFLPGTEEEKMGPWMGALDDNLEVLAKTEANAGDWGRSATNDLMRSRIKIKSLNFMRGRTFLSKYLIIDEAQNLTPKQMKTLITRAGPGTKIVCMGNLAQIDTPYLSEGSSGLTYAVDRFKGWPHSGHITLARGERSRLADFASEVL